MRRAVCRSHFTFQITDNDRLAINKDTYTGPKQVKFRQTEKVLNGGYQIVQLDDNTLHIIDDKDCRVTAGQPQACRYRLNIMATRQ